jgi:hypothetical protein
MEMDHKVMQIPGFKNRLKQLTLAIVYCMDYLLEKEHNWDKKN